MPKLNAEWKKSDARGQELYDFTRMLDIAYNTTNKKAKQTSQRTQSHGHRQQKLWLPEGSGLKVGAGVENEEDKVGRISSDERG